MTKVIVLGNDEGPKLAAQKQAIAISVDVLRASTTIPVAMNQGLETIYVSKEVQDTRQTKTELDTLLTGERDCIKLPGFDFGNSPVEMSKQESFEKDSTAFTSSTGARRTVESIGSKYIIIGSIINAQAVARKAMTIAENENLPIIIIPTFTKGSILEVEITEDQLGGLFIAGECKKLGGEINSKVNEEIDHLEKLLEEKSIHQLLLETQHGKKLIDLEYGDDIEYCSRLNNLNVVPISKNDIITLSTKAKIVKLEKEEI